MAEFEEKLPGLAGHMEPADPGMHTTATIDFEVVLQGSVDLELDDGAHGHARRRRHRGAERHPPPLEQRRDRAGRAGRVHLRCRTTIG